jgi:hypothetical protein
MWMRVFLFPPREKMYMKHVLFCVGCELEIHEVQKHVFMLETYDKIRWFL